MATDLSDWHELAGQVVESGDRRSNKAVVKYHGPWLERYEFIYLIFSGYGRGAGWTFQHRKLDDPRWNYWSALRPQSWTCIPLGGAQQEQQVRTVGRVGLSLYEVALVTVTYGLPPAGEIETDPEDPRGHGDVISEQIVTTSEFQTLPSEGFKWESDGAPLAEQESPGRRLIGLDYVFTRHNIDMIPQAAYDLVEHTNKQALRTITPTLGNKEFAPGTILYHGYNVARSQDILGVQTKQTVSYRFGIRERRNPGEETVHGWSSDWRADIGKYDKVVPKEGDPVGRFPEADLTVL